MFENQVNSKRNIQQEDFDFVDHNPMTRLKPPDNDCTIMITRLESKDCVTTIKKNSKMQPQNSITNKDATAKIMSLN